MFKKILLALGLLSSTATFGQHNVAALISDGAGGWTKELTTITSPLIADGQIEYVNTYCWNSGLSAFAPCTNSGSSFDPASPGPIGNTTSSTGKFTTVVADTAILTNVEYSLGTCTTAATVNPANGTRQKVTLTNAQTCALTFTQPASGTASVTLKITQSAVSSYSGAISGCKWPGGVVPTITATNAAVDFVSVYLNGTTAYCVASQNFQ